MTRGLARGAHRHLAVVGWIAVMCTAGHAAQIIHADGRRETVEGLRRGSDGRWSYEVEGRRTMAPSDIVLVIDDHGETTETIAALSDATPTPAVEAALAAVADPGNKGWLAAADTLAADPRRAVHDALVAMTASREKEIRRRGVTLLTRLRTKESTMAALTVVVAEKEKSLRRAGASALFSVREIVTRCDSAAALATGLADQDRDVRVCFALLASPAGGDAPLAVLRENGITHEDHHYREDSAMALGRRGDAAGEKILIGMLGRAKIPGLDDPELGVKLLIAEQVEICEILGKIGTEAGRGALEKARKSKHEAVRAAAEKALAPAKEGAERS